MKTRRQNSETGGALVITLIICGLIGVMLVAYLSMVSSQHRFSQRSQVWNNCMPLAEAGVEEALAHINYIGTQDKFGTNGWTFSGGFYRKERFLNGGRARIAVDTNMPPTITVTSILSAPVQSASLRRAVQVKTRFNQKFAYGVLGKGLVDMGGNGRVDSFDSTKPGVESDASGQYVLANSTDRASVVTSSTNTGNLTIGNGSVFGTAATGPGGNITIGMNGNVGSATFNNNPAYDGRVEGGHYTDDVNVYIPPGALPVPYPNPLVAGPSPGVIGMTPYQYILGTGDYRFNVDMTITGTMIVTGKARIHLLRNLTVTTGAIQIAPGASVEIYVSGSTVAIGGAGVINYPGFAKNLAIIGLPTCTRVDYTGTSIFCGTIYAPHADIKMTGTAQAIGAWVGKTFKITGTMDVHYDESLKGKPNEGRYIAASWKEL
jgi:hypothetical protein